MTSSDGQAHRGRAVTVRARGHPLIRASHDKTIELVEAADITGRATCVIGVGAAPLDALAGLRGPLEITVRAGARQERVRAVANPRFVPGPRAVVRCSHVRSPETLAVAADKAAAALDRALAAALADPATELLVTVAESATSPEQTALVLVTTPALAEMAMAAERLPAELTGLSLVVATGEGDRPAAAVARRVGLDGVAHADDLAAAWSALRRGGAVLVVTGLERPQRWVAAFVREVAEAGIAVRAAAGVDPLTATLVAAGLPGCSRAVLGAPPRSRRERERQLAALAALGVTGVWTGSYAALAALASAVAARWPGARAALAPVPDDADEATLLGTAAGVADRVPAGSRTPGVFVAAIGEALGGGAGGGGQQATYAPLRVVAAGLLRERVPVRTAAAVLQHAAGVPRRSAYALVLDVKAEMGADGD